MSKSPKVPDATILKAWNALSKIALAREAATVREAELVKTRKHLDNELDELGAGKTQKHLEVSREFVVTTRAIEFQRDRKRHLADQMEGIIKAGLQGKFEFADDDIDERELVRPPTEEELWQHKPTGEGEKPEHEKPVGRTAPQPTPELPLGEDQHLASPILDLDMRDQLKVKCIDSGFSTIGQLARIVDGPDSLADMAEKTGLGTTEAGSVIAAVTSFRAKHRDAMRKAEAGAAGGTEDNRAKVGGKGAGRKRGTK